MRRIVIFFCLTSLIFCVFCLFTGCDSESSSDDVISDSQNTSHIENENSDFISVASIEYNANKDASATYPHTTLNSECYIKYSKKSVTASEYENAENKIYWLSSSLTIYRNGKARNGLSIEELVSLKGKTYYYRYDGDYFEITFTDIVVACIEVKFFDDGSFLIKQLNDDGTISTNRIKPVYYSVTYFDE